MYHVNARDLPGNDVSRTFEGGKHGPCTVSFFLVHNRPGEGPNLHRHAYDETFVILEGSVLVRVGDESLEGGPGDIVIGPAGTPHGFTNRGPGPARLHPCGSRDEDRMGGLNTETPSPDPLRQGPAHAVRGAAPAHRQ
jgi:quercetin dioxygenase-like cupin family protein